MLKAFVLVLLLIAALAATQLRSQPSGAAFHLAVANEVMTSYGGDSQVQFVEIGMLASGQRFVKNSVLAAFDASGNYTGDVLVVPGNVPNSGVGVTWLMATDRFQAVTGLMPDFTMPAGLPTGGGMVCWGAPGVLPPPPGSWDHTNPENYVDCLAYGTYSGPTNSHIGNPTPLNADGHSLQRVNETNDNATDFACGDPATPQKNSAASVSLGATTGCDGTPVTCLGMPATRVGTTAADMLTGTAGVDVIVALGGDDTILTGGGNDIVCAGDGNDMAFGGGGVDVLLGEGGMDMLAGGMGFDVCAGGPDADTATACELTFSVP
ncbi:MAG TPA: hypothetical protein VFT91_00015 [Dehalococcoidia bacterium]|nr:hypothetical protein [Dehalococcoidia bacterium]